MNNKKKITFKIKHLNFYGRIKKRKKDLLIGKCNLNNHLNISDETANNYIYLEKLNKNKYIKSILHQKVSCSIFKNINKSDHRNNEVKDFLYYIKNSLFLNPTNVTSLFNLVYFYNTKNDIQNCLFYSFILHAILMKIMRKYFYTTKIADRKKNYLKCLILITYRKKLKDSYKSIFIKKIVRKWKSIPPINDKVLLILLLENLHYLYLNNYKLLFIDRVIYYVKLMLKIIELNKIYNYIKRNFFFLNSNLYFIKASCFLLVNSNEKKLISRQDNKEQKVMNCSSYIKNIYNDSNNGNKSGSNNNSRLDIMLIDKNEIEDILNEHIINKNGKKVNEKLEEKDFFTYEYNNEFHINNILDYEKQFLSFIISEEDITKKIEKMNDCYNYQIVNVKCTLTKLNDCVKFCLNNRLYQFLEQFLIWRARFFFHLRYFEECLSDTCKVSLMNIYSIANLCDNDNIYSCFNLRIISLKKMNMLNKFDLLLARILKINIQKKERIDDKRNKKIKYINEREHQYTWCRSFEDQNILNYIKCNKKKIPFIY